MSKSRVRSRTSRTAQACLGIALLAISTLAAVAAQPLDTVLQQVESELRNRAGATQNLIVELDAGNLANQPACSQLEVNLASHTRLRSRMSVPVRCVAPQRWQGFVQARLSMPGTYWVASRNINPGEPLDPSSLEPQEGDLLSLPPGVIQNPEDLHGQVASRRIGAGQMVRSNAVRSALAVQRGETVRLRVRGSSFVAMGEGQAMENANPGHSLQVRTASGQVISGILQADGIVDISM